MLNYGKKLVRFPTANEDMLKFARKELKLGRLSTAAQMCLKADSKLQNEETALLYAEILTESGMYHRCNCFIAKRFPNLKTRPVKAISLMRENYFATYEYTQERKMILELVKRGEKPRRPCANAEIDAVLDEAGLMLNDTFTFGCDLSSLTYLTYEQRSIMGLCAVFRVHKETMCGEFRLATKLYETCIPDMISLSELTMPEQVLYDNQAYYILPCLLSGKTEKALKFIDRLKAAGYAPNKSLALLGTYSLLMHLSKDDESFFDTINALPATNTEDCICISEILRSYERFDLALKFTKKMKDSYPYIPEANHALATCLAGVGDYKGAFCCYDTITKFFPNDITAQHFKKLCKEADETKSWDKDKKLPETFTAGLDIAIAYSDEMEKLLSVEQETFKHMVEGSEQTANMLVSLSPILKPKLQKQTVSRLCACESGLCNDIMRSMLLENDLCYDTKQAIVKHLLSLDETQRVAVVIDKAMFEAPLGALEKDSMPQSLYGVYEKCRKSVKTAHGLLCVIALNNIFEYYIDLGMNLEEEDNLTRNAFAFITHIAAAKKCGFDDDMIETGDAYYDGVDIDDIEDALMLLETTEREKMYDLYGNV